MAGHCLRVVRTAAADWEVSGGAAAAAAVAPTAPSILPAPLTLKCLHTWHLLHCLHAPPRPASPWLELRQAACWCRLLCLLRGGATWAPVVAVFRLVHLCVCLLQAAKGGGCAGNGSAASGAQPCAGLLPTNCHRGHMRHQHKRRPTQHPHFYSTRVEVSSPCKRWSRAGSVPGVPGQRHGTLRRSLCGGLKWGEGIRCGEAWRERELLLLAVGHATKRQAALHHRPRPPIHL